MTRDKLLQIIKEELEAVLDEKRKKKRVKAQDAKNEKREFGVSFGTI